MEERVGLRSVEAGGFGRAGSGRGEKRAASRVIGKDSTDFGHLSTERYINLLTITNALWKTRTILGDRHNQPSGRRPMPGVIRGQVAAVELRPQA